MYKRMKDSITGADIKSVTRIIDNTTFPFESENNDYVKFKLDIANGAELQDADGNVMTAEQVQEFLKTIP